MSKYTTEVRYICETYAGLDSCAGFADVEKVLKDSVNKVFDFDFPIFDESYREILERKILKHYYTREIAFETVGLWKLKLSTMMNEIMPYYNKLYESETYKFNPLYNVDYTKSGNRDGKGSNATDSTRTRNGSSSTTDHSTVENVGWNLYSDTPQGGLNGVDSMSYLTTATKTTSNTETDASITTTNNDTNVDNVKTDIINTEEYAEHVIGKMGTESYSSSIKEYRESLINIDMMIIDSIKDLFLMLW